MDNFIRFLEHRARHSGVRRSRRRLIWIEKEEPKRMLTEFIDMYYLGYTPGEYVVISRSMAREIEERLKTLEEENKKLKERLDLAKAVILMLAVVITILISLLSSA
ncbi:MAG: hypothetical protein DRJ49_03305 [Thermoprotei archaeon]|nr:MAG: hypothetical protein DRJ49_03305 [Thermoprotei archaeon]